MRRVAGNPAGDVAYMGHACGMNGDLTVLENLRSALHIAGVACSERACREVLARMGLAGREDDEVRHLSQGQRRRLALSRVQLSERPVWLLDEPLADLDANGEQALAQCLSLHAGQGGVGGGDDPPRHRQPLPVHAVPEPGRVCRCAPR